MCACVAGPICQSTEWSIFERTIPEVHCESNSIVLPSFTSPDSWRRPYICGPNFSAPGHVGCALKTDSLDHQNLDSMQDPRMCLWQAPPPQQGDPNAGDLECSLGNPALKIRSSPSGSHELPRPLCTHHFINTNLHQDGFLGCIIHLALFFSAGLPPRKSPAFKTRSMLKEFRVSHH